MQVGESTLKQLIEGEKQYQIPLYQRQYSWSNAQLKHLWSDVLEQYDLITPDETGRIDSDAPAHFFGSMVLAPSPMMAAHSVTPYLVIDGQQRLTTLLVAMCALRDQAAATDPTAVERFNERYIVNKYGTGPAYYRLLPTQADRDAFFACVNPEIAPKGNDLITRAYGFFRGRLTEMGPDGEPLDGERIEIVLRDRLQIVAITADQHDNVHRIFESLNDRGVRLTQADLLRNYIFMLLPNRAERVYEELWLPMQSSLSTKNLETLVYVDLVLRYKPTVKKQDVYGAQQSRLRPLEGDEDAIEDEVRELVRRAHLFKKIVEPQHEEHPDVRAAFKRLQRWGAATTYPLLLYVLDLRDRGECNDEDVVTVLSYVESFLVRRMLAGVPTNNLNRIFTGLVPQLPDDMPLPEAVRFALSGDRKYWASDERLREAIRHNPVYYQGRHDQKMLVFRRLEESYGHAEAVDWEKADPSIEHVMPQTLTEEWKAAIVEEGDDPEQVHDELLHTLGNLTVTAYNGELSNNPFERKKQILEDSHFELNKHISPNKKWGRHEILTRADELADRAIKIWPGPMPGVADAGERDWSRLHATLAALPAGAWTTYRDLAELIGSHQVPVGQHLANTPGVPNAHRVLRSDGTVSDQFAWSDPNDTRDVFDVLRSDGVQLDDEGHADPDQRMSTDNLADLLEAVFGTGPEEEESDYDWTWRRTLRYLRHFYVAEGQRLHKDMASSLAKAEGYDPRGVAGFYQGSGSLRVEGDYRVLTDVGRRLVEENQDRLADLDIHPLVESGVATDSSP